MVSEHQCHARFPACGGVADDCVLFGIGVSIGHMARASKAQGAHWANITKGDFGKDYVQSARTIGAVHARIGLEPRWYIGGYAIVIEKIVQAMVEHAWPSRLGDRLRLGRRFRGDADGGRLGRQRRL